MTQSPVRSDRPTTMAVVEPRAALPSVFNRLLTLMAAAVGPVIFVLFIDRYAVNVPQVDDWFVIPLVHSALHGHLTLTGLWTQFHHDRLLVGNLVFVFFGNIDRLDLRAITMFGAAAMIVGYGFLLALFRAYLDRPLTPIPTLIMGLVWFSLADVQNTLWAFQVSWFLVLPCLTGMLFFLLVPRSNRTLWVVLAVLAAVIASCSAIQGFLLWPIGLAVLLWPDPRNRHAIRSSIAWVATAAVMGIVYFVGYDFSQISRQQLVGKLSSTPDYALHHPLVAAQVLVAVVGNVVPTGGYLTAIGRSHGYLHVELVGAVVLAACVFVVVQSFRQRNGQDRLPLPLALIFFGFAFDLELAWSRSEAGLVAAVQNNRYVLPNLVIIAGLFAYAWKHLVVPRRPAEGTLPMQWLAMSGVTVLFLWQIVVAYGFGQTNGRISQRVETQEAQLVVNIDRVPKQDLGCELNQLVWWGILTPAGAGHVALPLIRMAAQDGLTVFSPASATHYRQLGPPADPSCAHATTSPPARGRT